MNYLIFGDSFTFPEGNAATNRVHTYAKGFYENGINVHVICFGNEYIPVSDGEINGYHFYHPFGQKKRNKYFVVRRWQKCIKYLKTIALIHKINKSDKIIAINCWTQLLITELFAFVVAKSLRTKIIQEHSEHPLRNYQGSSFKKMQGLIIMYFGIKLCDAIFCISQYLVDFYNNHGISQNKLLLVPSTVDTERFKFSSNSPFNFQYILYCGGLDRSKDGVDILIKSFSKISEKFQDINLVLIGKADYIQEELEIKDIVLNLNLQRRVIFLGQLSRTIVPSYLNNAKILALARPKSMVADAGFPSKLTEYLSTGKPIVVTNVGEIPVYLKDNENAFISISDNVEAFAEKLEFILDNYNYAIKVALKGKELTNTVFNYNFQAKRMIEFINTL